MIAKLMINKPHTWINLYALKRTLVQYPQILSPSLLETTQKTIKPVQMKESGNIFRPPCSNKIRPAIFQKDNFCIRVGIVDMQGLSQRNLIKNKCTLKTLKMKIKVFFIYIRNFLCLLDLTDPCLRLYSNLYMMFEL